MAGIWIIYAENAPRCVPVIRTAEHCCGNAFVLSDKKLLLQPITLTNIHLIIYKLTHVSLKSDNAGLILGLRPANARRYKAMPSLIGWGQT